MPPAKNPALVAKKIVDRALLLQNKVGCWVAHRGGRAHLLQAQILHGQGGAHVAPTGRAAFLVAVASCRDLKTLAPGILGTKHSPESG